MGRHDCGLPGRAKVCAKLDGHRCDLDQGCIWGRGATACAQFADLAGQAWVLAPRCSSLRTSLAEDGRLLLSNSAQVWERRGTVLMTGEGIRWSQASAALAKWNQLPWWHLVQHASASPQSSPYCRSGRQQARQNHYMLRERKKKLLSLREHWSAFLCQLGLILMLAQEQQYK